ELGGRVLQETSLKPLAEWRRVSDHRTYMLSTRSNVETYVDSALTAEQVLELGCTHVAIATGACWQTNFVGAHHRQPIVGAPPEMVLAPEGIFSGSAVSGKVMVYDDDHYYLASAIAEHLAQAGCEVVLVTPDADIASWTHNTLENAHIQTKLRELGVTIICNHAVKSVNQKSVTLECIYIGAETTVDIDAIVPVTSRKSTDILFGELMEISEQWSDHGVHSVTRIGDSLAPGTIAMAVYSGHAYARNMDTPADDHTHFKRENDFDIHKFPESVRP
ncbi:MAG: hypothetical protein HN582_06325, partial [Marinovum sp.]|nr:hypothetical protein [Marinovum sp.]